MRRRRLTTRKSNEAMQRTSSVQRTYVAVVSDRLSPVESATYAARHAGHLGTRTRTRLGTSQAKSPRTLPNHVGAFRSPAESQHEVIAVSPSDSCVRPARECARASLASPEAGRRDGQAGSIRLRGD